MKKKIWSRSWSHLIMITIWSGFVYFFFDKSWEKFTDGGEIMRVSIFGKFSTWKFTSFESSLLCLKSCVKKPFLEGSTLINCSHNSIINSSTWILDSQLEFLPLKHSRSSSHKSRFQSLKILQNFWNDLLIKNQWNFGEISILRYKYQFSRQGKWYDIHLLSP